MAQSNIAAFKIMKILLKQRKKGSGVFLIILPKLFPCFHIVKPRTVSEHEHGKMAKKQKLIVGEDELMAFLGKKCA